MDQSALGLYGRYVISMEFFSWKRFSLRGGCIRRLEVTAIYVCFDIPDQQNTISFPSFIGNWTRTFKSVISRSFINIPHLRKWTSIAPNQTIAYTNDFFVSVTKHQGVRSLSVSVIICEVIHHTFSKCAGHNSLLCVYKDNYTRTILCLQNGCWCYYNNFLIKWLVCVWVHSDSIW